MLEQLDREHYVYQNNTRVENRFYVYIHRRLSDNKPFYVGKGCGGRAWVLQNRTKHWKNVVNKHGYFVEIVFDDLDEGEAYQCEIDTILELKYFEYPLTNLTIGGEGVRGYKPTAEGIANQREARLNSSKWRDSLIIGNNKKRGRKLPEHVVNKRRDLTVYTFEKDGELFIGTRLQFKEFTGHNPENLFRKSGMHKSVHGWKLCLRHDNDVFYVI